MSIGINPTHADPYKAYYELQHQNEIVRNTIASMIDKSVEAFQNKEPKWIHNILKNIEGYENSLKSMTFFIPFIERNIETLLRALTEENESLFEEDEKRFFGDMDFHESLTVNLFNESFIGDSWFPEK